MPTMQAVKPESPVRHTRAKAAKSQVFTKYVGTLRVKPQAKQRLSLGNYTPQNPAKGYSIKLKTRGDTEDPAINTNVVMSGDPEKRYELMFYLENGSDRPVSAEIWQM